MFVDPAVGYAFSITAVIFIVEKYGWDALRTFFTDPEDFTVFGFADARPSKPLGTPSWMNFGGMWNQVSPI
jgi:hypothetical protein